MSQERILSITKKVGLVALALAILPMGLASAQPSGEEVIAKYVEATGGAAAYKGIKNSVTKSSIMIVAMGMSATSTAYVDGNNAKSVMAIDGFGEFLSGIKDGVPWSSNMMAGDEVLTGAAAKQAIAGSDPQLWLNWKNYYASAENAGEETVGDAAAWKVVLSPAEGDSITYWFAKDSGLIVQSEGPGLGGPALNVMSDYQASGGVSSPRKIVSEGANGAVEITVDSVENNTSIDAGVFDVPEAIATLMAAE